MNLKKSRTSKNDVRVVCDKCHESYYYCHYDEAPLQYFCDSCAPSQDDLSSTAAQYARKRLRHLEAMLVTSAEEDRKKGGYNPDHLVEKRDRFIRLINCVFEIAKKLQRPPQDLQELILCAVGIRPLGSQDMVEIARCFGFENSTDVKCAMMGLASVGKAKFNNYWQLIHV